MPAILTSTQTGRREDLADIIWLAGVTETPLFSMARKGKRLDNVQLASYQVKQLGTRKSGGVTDGLDFGVGDVDPPRALISYRGEVWRRQPQVGFIAEGNIVAGVVSEFSEAVIDQSIEHRKDIEKELFSSQDSQDDTGAGSLTRGLDKWINDGTTPGFSTELPVPVAFQTPTAQIYSATLGNGFSTGLTETVFTAMAQNRWDKFGMSNELTGFVGVDVQNLFNGWTRYDPAGAGSSTARVRTMTTEYEAGEYWGPSVEVIRTQWGTFTIMPVNTEYLINSKRGYFLDMQQIELRPREMLKEVPLIDSGGGPREGIQSILGLVPGDPRSHIKVVGS